MSKKKGVARLAPHQDPEDRVQGTNGSITKKDGKPPCFTLWKLEGFEHGSSSAGATSFYALTDSDMHPPSPKDAIDQVSEGRYELDSLYNMKVIGDAYPLFTLDGSRYDLTCANQTSRDMTPEIALLVASLIQNAVKYRSECIKYEMELSKANRELKESRAAQNRLGFGGLSWDTSDSKTGHKIHHSVHCPTCGHNFACCGKPTEIDGKDCYAAGWGGRGDLLVIPFHGECGHNWELCFGFHKGETLTFIRPLEGTDFSEHFGLDPDGDTISPSAVLPVAFCQKPKGGVA